MTRTTLRFTLVLATAAMTLQACAGVAPTSAGAPASAKKASESATTTTTPTTGGATATGSVGANVAPGAPAAAASSAPTTGKAAADTSISNNGASIVGQTAPAPVQTTAPAVTTQTALKAGAIDDNAKFADFLAFEAAYAGQKMRAYDASERHVIVVKDAAGKPVANTKVTVSAGDNVVWTGKTYANGQALFHPKANKGSDVGSRFFVTVGDNTATSTGFTRTVEGPWEIKLDTTQAAPVPKLDIQFVVDTTGSMGPEIAKLQATVQSIASRIKALPGSPAARFSLVGYKDQQDSEYLTKKTDFTGNITDFQTALNALSASGGGDLPEDLESALNEGLTTLAWDGATPIRLSFLITDAAPHIDYPQTVPYTTSIGKAQALGIKFYPIGASGLTKEGEFAMRQLAQATMGQYLFITRGGDEQTGGGEVSATVDKFKEGKLDDIVVDIVNGELKGLNGQ
ncbi:MAG: hypothetical protein JWM80_4597 [Cyanobacteria bacterium RYN_339]|nr:hypothetical protein [Cyanobacteria bacterium RYN_339]